MERTKEEIIAYFDKFIFGFIYHDIERCIKAEANYVVALALLSYTEYLGGLINGNLGLKDRGIARTNFNEALKYFPKEYKKIDTSLSLEYTDEKGRRQKETGIYGLFRCGMVHEYFIKGLSSIINDPSGQPDKNKIGIRKSNLISYIKLDEIDENPKNHLLIFHTNEYFRDFQSAVKNIYHKLVMDCDAKLLDGFNRSLDRLYSNRIIFT